MRPLLRIAGPLLVTCALLAGLEGVLRLMDFHAPVAQTGDPLLNPLPLYKPVQGADGVAMMQRHDAWGAFRQEKPANGFRVFIIGDSNSFGHPFGPEFAFGRFLQERLAAAMPQRTVEVVNSSLNGIGSWHARKVLDEVLLYQPDVIIMYVGHADWIMPGPDEINPLKRQLAPLRVYQLAAVAQQKLQGWRDGKVKAERVLNRYEPYGRARDRARGNDTLTTRDRQWITARYRAQILDIVSAAQAAGAKVILAGIVQNLRDYPPGASRHTRGLPEATRLRWREAIEHADARMKAGDCPGALEDLRTALRLDQRPAITHYLRGRCLDTLGRFASARAAYRDASERDEVPLGAPSSFNHVLQEVAQETGAQYVDVPRDLIRYSAHGLVGRELFLDYVHPTVAGHAAIARSLATAMGAPDGDTTATDVAALVAAHPEIQDRIYRANTLLYLMLGWHDQAKAELDEALQHYQDPELFKFRDQLKNFRERDSVRSWDDFPEAGE
jgi:lysophospholipase L1-like esterase